MKADIYLTNKRKVFFAVESGASIPELVFKDFEVGSILKEGVDLTQNLVGMDPKQVHREIDEHGYSVLSAEVGFQESTGTKI